MKDKGISDCIDGKSLKVFIVNPVVSQPWKTRKEYMNDDKLFRVAIACSVISTSASLIIAMSYFI